MNKSTLFSAAVFLIFLIASMPLVSAYSLTYDANGNLITGDGKYREYNGFNKLVRVRDGNNATGNLLEEYMWEADKDKVLVKHVYENNTWKESIYYPSQTFLMVKNASGTFKYKYIYQNGQLVAFENYDGKKFFVLGDHKGSASVITNESGAKVEETFYEPFGKIISGGATSRFNYEGKEFDSIVGMQDFGARQKLDNPPVFAQPDMNIPDIYNPQDLNRYAFERNNPYKYEDKDGKNPAIALMLVGFTMGTLSYAIQHMGEYSWDAGLIQPMCTAVYHGGIGAAAGLATGLTYTGLAGATAASGVGNILADTAGYKAIRGGIGALQYVADKSLEGERIDPAELLFSAGAAALFNIPGSQPGSYYSVSQLTKNSFIASKQYAWSSGIGLVASTTYNVFRQIFSYNMNADQAIRTTSQAAKQAEQLANSGSGGSSGGSGGYSWGVERIGNTLQTIIVQPIR